MIGRVFCRVLRPTHLCFRSLATVQDISPIDDKTEPCTTTSQQFNARQETQFTGQESSAKGFPSESSEKSTKNHNWDAKEEEDNQESSEESNKEEQVDKELKEQILKKAMRQAKKLGWSKEALESSAKDIGYTGNIDILFPKGPIELLIYSRKQWKIELAKVLEEMKNTGEVMDRGDWIYFGLNFLLKKLASYKKDWMKTAVVELNPSNVMDSVGGLNKIFDLLYKYEGDQSLDMSYYCKRMSLFMIYLRTKTFLMYDTSPDNENTWKFLKQQVDALIKHKNLMQWTASCAYDVPKILNGMFITFTTMLKEQLEKRHMDK